MKWFVCTVLMISVGMGCTKQQYGQCASPQDELEVLFKAKSMTNVFSHSFCVVCNTEIEPGEYSDWAVSMGANPLEDEYIDSKHPCLYVYSSDSTPESAIDSLEKCESAVCDGEATYADMVGKGQGNFDVTPLFEDTVTIHEEWLLEEPRFSETRQPSLYEDARIHPDADLLQQ